MSMPSLILFFLFTEMNIEDRTQLLKLIHETFLAKVTRCLILFFETFFSSQPNLIQFKMEVQNFVKLFYHSKNWIKCSFKLLSFCYNINICASTFCFNEWISIDLPILTIDLMEPTRKACQIYLLRLIQDSCTCSWTHYLTLLGYKSLWSILFFLTSTHTDVTFHRSLIIIIQFIKINCPSSSPRAEDKDVTTRNQT